MDAIRRSETIWTEQADHLRCEAPTNHALVRLWILVPGVRRRGDEAHERMRALPRFTQARANLVGSTRPVVGGAVTIASR